MSDRNSPIGVFDSGVGGLSVLKSLIRELPHEDYIYFGDSANAPYGTKSREEVERLAHAASEHLLSLGAKAVVVACNTATAAAISSLRERYPEIPFIGMEPALKPAVMSREHPRVIVMATPVTLRMEKFTELYRRYGGLGEVEVLPCPGLAEFVEAGDFGSEELMSALRGFLREPLRSGCDALVLGCTHYPFIKAAIRRVVGDNVQIFDGSDGTAREVRRRLEETGLISERTDNGDVNIENSGDCGRMLPLSEKLLAAQIADV